MTQKSQQRKPASLADIVASATRVERSATICVAGHLNAEYAELERRLQNATREASLSLDDGDPRRDIAQQMEALREQMREHEHEFTFRSLPDKEWSDLTAAHPAREGKVELYNWDTFPLACVAASLIKINGVDTAATVDDLAPLWSDKLNIGQRDELFTAAWAANTGKVSVPFSVAASKLLQPTAEK